MKYLQALGWATIRCWPMFFVGQTLARFGYSISDWQFWVTLVFATWMLEQGYKADTKLNNMTYKPKEKQLEH